MSALASGSNYSRLEQEVKHLNAIDHARDLLHWDDAVMRPPKSLEDHTEAMVALQQVSHAQLTSNQINDLIESAANEDLDEWQCANVREIRRKRDIACALPDDLLVAMTFAGSKCLDSWRRDREMNKWQATAALLEEVVTLTRQKAQCLGERFAIDPYDALINTYEDGVTQQHIDPLFQTLERELPELINDALAQQEDPATFGCQFSVEKQLAFSKTLMATLGFDFARGRIDTSLHPFSMGGVNDVRITTRFNVNNFTESTFATIHETGHALYTQGLPEDWRRQAVGAACGMMIHESQSLFMEMQVCRSESFLEFLREKAKDHFASDSSHISWSATGFRSAVRRVQKSLIRVDADEITYPLHIILRYNLEKHIMNGDLSVNDIPGAWNDLMVKYLDLSTVDDYRNGCMQDIHWYDGTFGYFPCYSLGAVAAAQFFAAFVAENDVPDVEFRRGDVSTVVEWLRRNIHSKGRFHRGLDLIENVTGRPLSIEPFFKHLKRRYVDGEIIDSGTQR